MTRTAIFSIVILVILGLAAGGNRIVGGILDAKLAPLLTRELGLPVQLAPMKANLLQLKASSPKLIMGETGSPSVVATDVVVSISLPALLEREIRLEYASATDLMVNPSRWPKSGKPLPDNYQFLDQWLPSSLEFESGQYVFEDGNSYPLQKVNWKRKLLGEGASATWSESRGGANLTLSAQLKSLQDLLQLAPIEIDWTAQAGEDATSAIALKTTVQPASDSAYKIVADIEAAGINTHIVATGKEPWTLPEQSQTTMDKVEPDKLLALFSSYNGSGKTEDAATVLESSLPHLQLPSHRGDVVIDEIRLGKEFGKDTTFKFSSSANGLQIDSLSSKGPSGILSGELGITSEEHAWTVKVDATMRSREGNKGIGGQFLESRWLWSTGRAQVDGTGDTWEALLNSLHGAVNLAGDYRGDVQTPVSIEAHLDNKPGVFGLDHMAVKLGNGQFTGSAALSGTDRRKLTVDMQGTGLNLGFLSEEEDSTELPGMALPEYLTILPSLDIDVQLDVTDLVVPGLQLATAQATLNRTAESGKLEVKATGKQAGTLDLVLEAKTVAGEAGGVMLSADFDQLDLPAMFQQQMLLHSRSSGHLEFHSEGRGISNVFRAMQGTTSMTVELRADNDWQRASNETETLAFSGNSQFVIENNRIIGVKIEKLDIDSIQQDLTGNVSLVAGRSPWLEADLESETLNIAGLQALLPDSTEEADQADLLTSLKRLGAAKVSLDVDSLTIRDMPLSKMTLAILSGEKILTIKQLDFTTHGSRLESNGNISWSGKTAKFESEATLSNVDLDQFLISNPDVQHIPVSGTAKLASEGKNVGELLGNLNGHIDLRETLPATADTTMTRRKLIMVAKRLPDGVQAEISTLQWGASELAGSVRYRRASPATLDIELQSGSLSLLPWESGHAEQHKPAKEADSARTGIGSAARTSANFVGHALLTPVRLLTGPDKPKPGERMFSETPLPLGALNKMNVTVKGQMDSIESTVVSAKDLVVNGTIEGGKLNLQASASQFSNGSADIDITLDSTAVPPALKVTTHFRDIDKFSGKETYTQSGFASFESTGTSPAELAASANGLGYIELGPGTFDYSSFAILTADLASTVFRSLIPGIENDQPLLECGVSIALVKDGIAATPYGFSLRTNRANLLGRVEVDLKTEKLQMSLDSRSREGMGISVGNVFSNAIRIRGTLSDPRVVPATTSIAWRGWAAFMTAGLSVIGESVIKRVLASDDPCGSTKKMIRKEICPESPLAASSPMVCPPG